MNKLVKSLLLAAPATLVAIVAAQAADLPASKASPVSYVKVCDAYGAGFFYIPGTDTCLHVGGYVRFETRYTPTQNFINPLTGAVSQVAGAQDETGVLVRGRVDLDARNQTDYGTLQEVVRLRALNNYGMYAGASNGNFGSGVTPNSNPTQGAITMERAYFRFAGLTAGVADENFTTMPGTIYGPTAYAGFPSGMTQIAYTATFGSGVSATIAMEEKSQIGSTVSVPAGSYGEAFSTLATSQQADRFTGGYLVGNVRYDAGWGYFQANAAVDSNQYELGTGALTSASATPANYIPTEGANSKLGWAAGFSFKYNLPALAPGDAVWFQFAYADGMPGLLRSSGPINTQSDISAANRELGGVIVYPQPYIVTSVTNAAGASCLSGTGGSLATAANPCTATVGASTGFEVYGQLTHYWTPTWRSNIQVGYQQINNPTAQASAGLQLGVSHYIGTSASLIWSPAKNFDIGVELDYAHMNNTLQNATTAFVAAGSPGLSEGNWSGILRLERQF